MYGHRFVDAVAIGRELDEYGGVARAGGLVQEHTGRQLRNVVAEDDIVAAQEIARIDGTALQGHFFAVAQNLDPIDDHHGQQRDLHQLPQRRTARFSGCGPRIQRGRAEVVIIRGSLAASD